MVSYALDLQYRAWTKFIGRFNAVKAREEGQVQPQHDRDWQGSLEKEKSWLLRISMRANMRTRLSSLPEPCLEHGRKNFLSAPPQ